jgi:hypothetical protein
MMDKEIRIIMALLEDAGMPGSTSVLSGAASAQNTMLDQPEQYVDTSNIGYGVGTEPEEPEFTDLEMRLAKRFLELIGGPERARDLINKCDECEDCLGLVGGDDESQISSISELIPSEVDLPTPSRSDLSSLYNPNATAGPYGS